MCLVGVRRRCLGGLLERVRCLSGLLERMRCLCGLLERARCLSGLLERVRLLDRERLFDEFCRRGLGDGLRCRACLSSCLLLSRTSRLRTGLLGRIGRRG